MGCSPHTLCNTLAPERLNLPDWINAWSALGAMLVALATLVWTRVDISKAKGDAAVAEARAKAMLQTMERMADAAEVMADSTSSASQVTAATTELRNAIHWKVRQVDRASNRIVYELINTGEDVAHGVTATAPDSYAPASLLQKLPKDATIHPHEGHRFYLQLRLSTPSLPALRVAWLGGDEVVAVDSL